MKVVDSMNNEALNVETEKSSSQNCRCVNSECGSDCYCTTYI